MSVDAQTIAAGAAMTVETATSTRLTALEGAEMVARGVPRPVWGLVYVLVAWLLAVLSYLLIQAVSIHNSQAISYLAPVAALVAGACIPANRLLGALRG